MSGKSFRSVITSLPERERERERERESERERERDGCRDNINIPSLKYKTRHPST